jgi:ABC-type lipoprotein release transport system permease subunit
VGAVWFVVRAELRHRWKSWLSLAVLVAVVGALVLATAAAGRRTASAFPRFAAQYGFNSFVYAAEPIPKLRKLPEVASALRMTTPDSGTPVCACRPGLTENNFGVFEVPAPSLPHFAKLVSGHALDQSAPDQVLASISLQQDYGVHVGSVLHVGFFTAAQANANATGPPSGPAVSLRVVGIEADESAFPSVGSPNEAVITTRAFDREVNPHTGLFTIYAVRLRHGAADLPRFDSDAKALGVLGTGDQEATATITNAIHPQAVGWWLLAALAALAGLATVAQALSRQAVVESEAYRTLAAMGLGPGRVVTLGMVRALVVGVAGAIGAVALAFALSPLTPVGEARLAEPDTGLRFDSLVLGLGGLAIVVAVVVLGIWPAVRAGRARAGRETERAGRPSVLATRLAAAGAPPSAVIGVRRALERGHGRNAVPVATALGGTVLAVAALCATTVFGASLTHLTATPRLYGQAFDVWFNGLDQGGPGVNPVLDKLKADPAVTAITLGTSGSVIVDGVSTDAIAGQALRGKLLVSSVSGRLPAAPGQVALGTKTLHQIHAHVGSVVKVAVPLPNGGEQTSSFHVVGTASFPPDFGVVGLSSGAIFSVSGFVDAQCAPGPAQSGCRSTAAKGLDYVLLASVKPGAAGRAAVARYVTEFPGIATIPVTPTNLVNFGEAVNFPLILGVVLVLFGMATLVHVLVVSVARRRRELGLLKALGFVRHQAAAAVCWQATTVAVVGIVIGVPLGVAVGHLVWNGFATNLGVVPDPVIPAVGIAVLAIGAVVVANALALGPAFVSARQHPSPLLRSE